MVDVVGSVMVNCKYSLMNKYNDQTRGRRRIDLLMLLSR